MTELRRTFESCSAEDTERLAHSIGRSLAPGDLVTLEGELGAGKTQFARGIAVALGHRPELVSSPTFVLMNEYSTPGSRCPLVHIDAYRLGESDDLESLGLDGAYRANSVVAVEWASRIADRLPTPQMRVYIEHSGGASRRITIETGGTLSTVPIPAPHRVPCRTCGTPVDPAAPGFPFCSSKCRMADLGKWFSGSYSISREIKQTDATE